MMRRMLPVSALAVLLPLAWVHAEPAKGDKDLDGDWEIVSVVRDGKEMSPPGGKSILTIKGETATFQTGDRDQKGTIKVDPSKTPKTMDLTPEDGPEKGKTLMGVYEVKGDELRVCHGGADKDRPKELSAKEGSGLTLATFKRVKK